MNLGMPEMIFIFLLALVIFGPRKLPELGRQLGKALSEFKKASNEFKNQLEVEMMNIELEERSKNPGAAQASDTKSPIEKLFDTISGPPGSVSRGSLETYNGPPITDPAAVEYLKPAAPAPAAASESPAAEKPATEHTINPAPQPAHDA